MKIKSKQMSPDISIGQSKYLADIRHHKFVVKFSRILILILFIGLWEFTATTGIIDSFIFSSPSKIALCFWNMVLDKSIFLHLGITLYETIVSFILTTMISILVAVVLWFSKKSSEIADPYLVVLNSLPKSALAPLLIVWLGATQTTIIAAGMSVAIFGSILNLYTSFTTVDPGKIKLIYTLHQYLLKFFSIVLLLRNFHRFLQKYFETSDIEEKYLKKIHIYKIFQDFLWSLWTNVKEAKGDDFGNYGIDRYNRAKENLLNI